MSGLIPREFINDLIARTDIIELIDSRVPLKKAGRNYQACCPFHNEKSPSFTVSSTKQFYYCFGCGASGNAIGFLMAYEKLEFIEAIEVLAKSLGLEVPHDNKKTKSHTADLYEPLQKAKLFYEQALRKSPDAIQYLKNRGLTGEIVKKYGIGYTPDRKRIAFPIHDRRGRVIGFGWRVLDNSLPKYINSPDSPLFHKSNVLYGLYEAREANQNIEKLVVVEGYMDVVSLAQSGITFAVATLGTATTPQHISQLFQQTNKIIFCFDGDNAGRKAAWRAVESTLSMMRDDVEARFLFLPDGEDPDSLVKKEGKEKFLLRLDEAQTLTDFFFNYLKSQASINSVEGRAKFAKLALSYIENIPAVLFKEMLLDKLSELVRLEKSRLQNFTKEIHVNKVVKIQRTPMRLAISLLLQYPYLASEINFDIQLLRLQGSELLKSLVILLNEHPSLNTAGILEYFRDQKDSELLYKLAAWEHGVPEEGVIAEFHGVMKYFQREQRKMDVEELLQKANQGLLKDEEKIMLQRLLEKPLDSAK